MDTLRGCTSLAIAAMSIFVASHLVSHPLNTDLVSGFVRIYRHETYNTYRLFYPERATVVDGEFLSLLREGPEPAATESQLPIAWPEPEVADEMWDSIAVELEANIQPRSVEYFRLIEVSRFIFHILLGTEISAADNGLPLAALSIHLASYLRQVPMSRTQVAAAVGVSESDFNTIYESFYPHREDLLRDLAGDTLWTENDVEELRRRLSQEVPSFAV